MAKTYRSLQNYPKALDAANQALKLSQQYQYSFNATASLGIIASIYLTKGDYQNALDSYQKILTDYRKAGLRIKEAETLSTEAHANIRKGANPELLSEERRLQALIDGKEKVRFDIIKSDKIHIQRRRNQIAQIKGYLLKLHASGVLSEQVAGVERRILNCISPSETIVTLVNSQNLYIGLWRKRIVRESTQPFHLAILCQRSYEFCLDFSNFL